MHRYIITGPAGVAEADTLDGAQLAKRTMEREHGVAGARQIIIDRGPANRSRQEDTMTEPKVSWTGVDGD